MLIKRESLNIDIYNNILTNVYYNDIQKKKEDVRFGPKTPIVRYLHFAVG